MSYEVVFEMLALMNWYLNFALGVHNVDISKGGKTVFFSNFDVVFAIIACTWIRRIAFDNSTP